MARLASTSSRVEAGRTTDFVQNMYTVYVLKSKIARKSYVGITDDLERRVKEHNNGKSFYTKRFTPWEVIHTEKCETRQEARKREKYLKSAAGRSFLKQFFKE